MEGLVRQSAAPAGDLLNRKPQKNGKHRRGGGGVADAHFPHTQHIRPGIPGHLDAGEDGSFRLLSGHCGPFGQVRGAVGDFPVQNLGLRHIVHYAHIHHGDAAAEVLAQGRGPGFGPGQVHGLLQCHDLGGAGHALFHHAVVRGEHQQVLIVHAVL